MKQYILNGIIFNPGDDRLWYWYHDERDVLLTEYELKTLGAKPVTEHYKCPSYYDNNNQLQNCTCGKCGKEVPAEKDFGDKSKLRFDYYPKEEKIELPKDDYPSKEMRVWMQSVTNWINSHEREK